MFAQLPPPPPLVYKLENPGDSCPGLTEKDISEIREISKKILGKKIPIMFVIFGGVRTDESYPVILFCSGADASNINFNYERIEIFNQEVTLYLKK